MIKSFICFCKKKKSFLVIFSFPQFFRVILEESVIFLEAPLIQREEIKVASSKT